MEDKDLLLKDLCSRLPYGVKIQVNDKIETLKSVDMLDEVVGYDSFLASDLKEVKPYLFPLLSMTEEQKIECFKGTPLEIDKYGDVAVKDNLYGNSHYTDLEIYLEVIDWLNKSHFDYRGLIEKDLAIDATGLNIY